MASDGKPSEGTHEDFQMLLYGYMTGALTSNLVELGNRLGIYKELSDVGPCTPDALAQRLKLTPRYVAEWLRQQAAARVISCDETAETFWLTPVQQDVLVNERGDGGSPYFSAGGFQSLPGLNEIAAKTLPELFRSGDGLPYDAYAEEVTCGTCRMLGVWARHFLVDRMCAVPGLKEKLEGGCQLADVGCGCGEALLAVAAAFPASAFRGFDISEKALARARAAAKTRNLTNVEFVNPGLEEGGLGVGVYDIAMTHDAIHDMAHPKPVMANVHKALKGGAVWLLGDMAALESHGENVANNPLASFCYGFSCHLCLPSAMSAPNPAGLGTLGLSKTLAETMLKEAGFKSVEVIDWGHPLNRYYLCTA